VSSGSEEGAGGATRADKIDADAFKRFTLQAAILAWAALILFWALYSVDHYVFEDPAIRGPDPFTRYFNFNADSDQVAGLASVNIAVFGIVITIVSIIVQLSADRYTGVANIFLRDPINVRVAAYYVLACVVSIWLSSSIQQGYIPQLTLLIVLCVTTGGLVIMMPYFGYVFWFLEPQNLIRRISRDASTRARKGALTADPAVCHTAQADALIALEELTDIANNSISGKDKIIAGAAVDALRDFALEHLALKPQASEIWFAVGPEIRPNPDFVAMDPESLEDLEAARTWVEWKVMRQYLSIYNDALGSMRDINYLIAIDTRYIGEAAAKAGDKELVQLVFRFFNSYLRSTLNAKDVRTSYNVLNQYRKLVESMLNEGAHRAAVDGVKHMKYYGLVSFEMKLNFVTETVAYDMSSLAQHANEFASPAEKEILAEFLELDRPPFIIGQERALLGVRKAQVKLAAYYVATGQEDRARAIARDMRDEPRERLLTIRHQLGAVESKEFWEIIDRGRNFEYMPPQHREALPVFFSWLDLDAPAARSAE
jgi:hypothetical protein